MDDMRHHTQNDRLTLRLPSRLSAELDEAARAEERTRSEYVREILRRDLRARRGAGDANVG
jgi:metal-responsive CopG/Arc/MetJ family transcriptional regulator